MPNAYSYSNVATQQTLTGSISSGATSINVSATTGFPGSFPYILAVDYGAATEELVRVDSAAGSTLTVVRGFGGTSAQSHGIGALVRHVVNAQDLTDFRTHEASTGAVHGLTGSIVGTSDTQTLSNKTLTAPTINAGVLSGTFSGSPVFSGGPTFNTTAAIFNRTNVTDVVLRGSSGGDTFDRFQLLAGGTVQMGPGNAALDVNLYRAGANLLKTDDAFQTVGELQPQNLVRGTRANATDSQFETRVTGDSFARWFARADGQMSWGPGSAGADITLQRSSAGVLGLVGGLLGTSSQTGAVDHLMMNATAPNAGSFLLNLKNNGNSVFSVDPTGKITQGGVGQMRWARKTADTSVTSSSTISDDPHLIMAVDANSVYMIEGVMFISSASATPDFKMALAGPSGSTGTWSSVGYALTSSGAPDAVDTRSVGIGSTKSFGIPNVGTVFGLPINGMIETISAGNLSVQWSQDTSSSTPTNLKLYSWLRLTKVS